MAGQSPERRRALAIVTAVRNVPLAFLIANASFADSVAGPVTLVFSVYTMIGAVIYAKLILRGQPETDKTESTS
jgi:predicted Na+-dependent transporter